MVYFVRAGDAGPIKIGRAKNPLERMALLQTGCPEELHLLAVVEGDRQLERLLHRTHRDAHLRGEWFQATDELLAVVEEARGRTVVPGSFEDLARRDPRLGALVADVRAFAEQAPRLPTVCAEDAMHRRFEPQLARLVGWGRIDEPLLRTRRARELAEAAVRAELPACRGCLCEPLRPWTPFVRAGV